MTNKKSTEPVHLAVGELSARVDAIHESHQKFTEQTLRTFQEIRSDIERSHETLTKAIRDLSQDMKPKFHTYAAWASVVIAFVAIFGSLLGYGLSRELAHTYMTIQMVTERNKDDIDDLNQRVTDNQSWVDWRVREELKELWERRQQ